MGKLSEVKENRRIKKTPQLGHLNVPFIWYSVQKGRKTLNTMECGQPRLRREAVSGTVDYFC